MSTYEHDPMVRYQRGGYTVTQHGWRYRVMPYEAGRRWGIYAGAPRSAASVALSLHGDGVGYRTADDAIASLIGAPQR